MTTSKLPARPSLESLRKQAKKLARDIAAGEAGAIARARAELPKAELPLSQRDAQLVLAREYGFPGWQDLVKEVKERLVHRSKIVAIRVETCANAIDVAERGKELERSGKKASAVEEIEQPLCAGSDQVIAYRRRDDCAGIDQELGTYLAREDPLAGRFGAGAVGFGSHPEQPAVVFIRPPRQ